MPPQIGDFISQHVYEGQLKSNPKHVIPSSVVACHFVDVNGAERLDKDGKSFFVSCGTCRRANDTNIGRVSMSTSEPERNRGDHAARSAPPRRKHSLPNNHP